jgi:dihydroorotate dehydrogenase (NAD+) catalytic subunit
MAQMVRALEGSSGVTGIEISLPLDASAGYLRAFLEASLGELPLIVRLPLESALEFGDEAINAGASAVSLGAPRGALPLPDGGILHGRVYGPAVLPLALEVVMSLAARGIPVIGAGGIYSQADAQVMLQAGALAVQLDAALWSEY